MSTDTPATRASRSVSLPFLSAVAVALGLAVSTLIAATSWKDVRKRPEKNNIRITGSARKRIVSDLIQWSAGVEAQGKDRTAAYVALKGSTEKVVAFLKAQGVKEDEILTESTSIIEEFDVIKEDKVLPGTTVPLHSERKESKGFKALQVVRVNSTNVTQIEKVSREITTLLEQGVDVISNDPSYYYTHLGELKLEMLAEAAKDARARAENILNSAGNTHVSKLVYADMGIININAANSTETSNEGNNDTTSRDKDIITIVHAEFELE
ncbi:MAG: SIMPL domain-containing protein [Luteolibacter sp.]